MQRNGYNERDAVTALYSTTTRVAGQSLAGLGRLLGLAGGTNGIDT
ncbi:hypothetical protein MKZ24_00490 [Paenibacillus sp. FSL R7-0297]|nr:hypothetical protein [Paenibacillus sp. FSL R5-0912]